MKRIEKHPSYGWVTPEEIQKLQEGGVSYAKKLETKAIKKRAYARKYRKEGPKR